MNAIQENANDSESQVTEKKDLGEFDDDEDEDLGRDQQDVIELDKVSVNSSAVKKQSQKQRALISQEEAKAIIDKEDKLAKQKQKE